MIQIKSLKPILKKGYLRPGMCLVDAFMKCASAIKSQSFDKHQEMSLNPNLYAIDEFQLEVELERCLVGSRAEIFVSE